MDLFRREWFVEIDGDGDFDAVDYIILDEILSDDDMKKPSIRFSFSSFNKKDEVDYVVGVLKEFIEK